MPGTGDTSTIHYPLPPGTICKAGYYTSSVHLLSGTKCKTVYCTHTVHLARYYM